MRRLQLASFIVGAYLASACQLHLSERSCFTDEDCVRDGVMGTCLSSPTSSSQWCAFSVDPSDCSSTLEWGPLSGDELAETCVSVVVDAGVDASSGVDAGPDAAPPYPRAIIASKDDNQLYVYDATTLAPLGPTAVPNPIGGGFMTAGVTNDIVYVTSISHIFALDRATLTLLPGYPVEVAVFDGSMLMPYTPNVVFADGAMFSVNYPMGKVFRFEGDPLAEVDNTDVPGAIAVLGGRQSLLVPYAGSPGGMAILHGDTLEPRTPTSNLGFPFVSLAFAIDNVSFRIAIGGDHELDLRNSETLVRVDHVTYTSDNVASVAFDSASRRLFVGFTAGKVATYDAVDLVETVAPVQRARVGNGVYYPQIDGGRVYAIDSQFALGSEWRLLVLDLATLEHVPGSPIILPGEPAGLAIVH